MREGKPSHTAAWVAALRGLAPASEGTDAPDPIARDLVPQPYALAFEFVERFPSVWNRVQDVATRYSAYHFSHVSLRTRAIDEAVSEAVAGGVRQLVVLGAGLDSRAWRLPNLRDTMVFEVDHPATQAYKRAKIGQRPSFAREVRFVAVDFERDALEQRLGEAGHDATQRTAFIWEGVTMYLQPEVVDHTLSVLERKLAARGSTLCVTYGQRHKRNAGAQAVRWLVRRSGEPFRALYTPETMGKLLARHGFEVLADEGLREWVRRYLAAESPGSIERLARAVRV
ncbi:SAM-dependent methyltransferase [Pendulispora rubella]|uniref:S-adenosyl-L-methionine-dependent methyltransferase n=1 Tax=Pendulispora rubella TaxID=2741070 RepID=A0ABZ2LHT6_9BACT